MKTGAFMCFALVLGAITIPMAEGSSSGGKTRYSGAHIISLAKNVEKTLAAEGARVAIISRVGRDADVLPDGIRYTHVAFAVYSQITTTDGERIPGYAVYNLYQDRDQPAASSLVQDFPVDYFAAVHELRSGIIIPTVEMQKRLLATIFPMPIPVCIIRLIRCFPTLLICVFRTARNLCSTSFKRRSTIRPISDR